MCASFCLKPLPKPCGIDPRPFTLYVAGCYVSLMATYRAFYILEWASTANEYRWYVYHVLHCTALTQALIFVVFLLDHVTRCANCACVGAAKHVEMLARQV